MSVTYLERAISTRQTADLYREWLPMRERLLYADRPVLHVGEPMTAAARMEMHRRADAAIDALCARDGLTRISPRLVDQ